MFHSQCTFQDLPRATFVPFLSLSFACKNTVQAVNMVFA